MHSLERNVMYIIINPMSRTLQQPNVAGIYAFPEYSERVQL